MDYDNWKLETPPSFSEETPEMVICEYCGGEHSKGDSNSISEDWDMDGLVDVWVCNPCLKKYKK